ncbi:MAG: cytochrome c [Clostridia bacterium]|nr:cytochrome c [Deltaproteobacteria bacterium]
MTLSLSREGTEIKRLTLSEMTAIAPMADVDVDDPVYGRSKHYKAVPLKPLLKAAYGKIDDTQQFVIHASDGYAVSITGDILTTDGAYLAFRDREAPSWEPIGPQKVSPAPLYMVWRGADQRDMKTYPWPWAVLQFDAVSLDRLYAKASPGAEPTESVARGHELVLHRCIKCHPVNGQGGHLGPELNIPKNVTEYWPIEQIKSYVRDPSSLRYGNMPPNPDLSNQDLDDLVAYLSAMKDHKL